MFPQCVLCRRLITTSRLSWSTSWCCHFKALWRLVFPGLAVDWLSGSQGGIATITYFGWFAEDRAMFSSVHSPRHKHRPTPWSPGWILGSRSCHRLHLPNEEHTDKSVFNPFPSYQPFSASFPGAVDIIYSETVILWGTGHFKLN